MTNMVQVCGNFRWARAFVTNTDPDEIGRDEVGPGWGACTRGVGTGWSLNPVHASNLDRLAGLTPLAIARKGALAPGVPVCVCV